ncbi:MAG: dTDP-glucose 4,6-dehydratase [Oscillospiraceae bacterium]|nr:dTDP-glucose 4,6-dehydratase [Oscillospiraceae bacterium]
MTVIVTGGAGFIGANFIYYLLNAHPDWRVVCLDKLTYAGNLSTLRGAMDRPDFRFVRLDICDRAGVYALFREEKPEIVVNFAAETHVDRSIEDPGIFLQTNVVGAGVLMDACRDLGVERFHQVSTDEVYGDLPLDRPELFFTEETPLRTSSPYSSSKAGADLLAMAYWRTYGLPVTISRCSNNYGPWQFPEKLIPLMIANCLHDKPLPVYGKGENVRDWLYVEDHCRAIDLILQKGTAGEVYNVGGHNEMRNIDIVKLICAELGKPESLITFVTDRKGHDKRYAIDPAKIHAELGWLPETKFADGLHATIRWYLEHRGWWEEIVSGEYRNYYEKMYAHR